MIKRKSALNQREGTMKRPFRKAFLMLIALSVAIGVSLFAMHKLGHSPMPLIDEALDHLPVELVSWRSQGSSEPVVIGNWPPKIDEVYPELILTDQNGDKVNLADFAGQVILVELAAVPCEGCQAFAGGKKHGGFGGFSVQPGLESIHHYAQTMADVSLGEDVVFVQILLYGENHSSPTQEEVSAWAKHFQMDRQKNQIVLRGDPSMLSRKTFNMIPGFHLIDRRYVLRSDSCGHRPKENLYTELLPKLGDLARPQ